MKKISILGGICAVALFAGAASANDELLAGCEAFQAEYGGNSDCQCLADAVASDDDLVAEFLSVTSPDDVPNLSEAAQSAIASCSAS